MNQDFLLSRQYRIKSLVTEFESQMRSVSDSIISEVSSYLRRSLEIQDGRVVQTPGNASVMRDLDRTYRLALPASGHPAVIAAFVSQFSDQLTDVEDALSLMGADFPDLPIHADFSEADAELLGRRAAMSLAALEAQSLVVAARLRQASVLTLGEFPLDQLVEHVSLMVGKTADVGLLGQDLLASFFRSAVNMTYREAESSGTKLLYKYAGIRSKTSRESCATLLDSGKLHTRVEVEAIGDGLSFENAGGPNCLHFWEVAGVVQQREAAA